MLLSVLIKEIMNTGVPSWVENDFDSRRAETVHDILGTDYAALKGDLSFKSRSPMSQK